jgi:branched-chain amino acid transport system substrate-binding protein
VKLIFCSSGRYFAGSISFDGKGDRKDAEMTIFTMKSGKIEPIAVIKGGKTIPYAEFIKGGK